jgi:putative FmdB family regulatory protein
LALEECECQEGIVPTYQYACTACGHQLEAVQSFADEPLTECPACEGRLRKLFSSVGVVFKGSGFYRTDSRNGSAQSAKKDTEPAKKDTSPVKDTAATSASTPKTETASTSS